MERTWCKAGAGAELLIHGARVVDPLSRPRRSARRPDRARARSPRSASGSSPARARASSTPRAAACCPGFVDLHAHLRTPGREDEEDLATASAAAAAGGYVAIFGMANTEPVVDTAAVLEGLIEAGRRRGGDTRRVLRRRHARARRASSSPRWASSAQAGAVGFSDDGRPLATRGAHAPRPAVRQGERPLRRRPRAGRLAHEAAARCTRAPSRPASASPASRRSARASTSPARSISPRTRTPPCTSATSARRASLERPARGQGGRGAGDRRGRRRIT